MEHGDYVSKHYVQTKGNLFKLKPNHELVSNKKHRASLRLGTDFGGLETPSQALGNLGINHTLEFYCEKGLHLRNFVAANFRPKYIIADVLDRDCKAMPSCDLFCWGYPCQPFSKLGLQLGLEDFKRRGILLFGSIDYIKEKGQRCS